MMKKIISLIIAGIMLASMAVTTSAVDFWGDDDLPYVADNPVFTDDDFRPNFREGNKKARDTGLYMQKYCGCIFSEEDRYLKQITRD